MDLVHDIAVILSIPLLVLAVLHVLLSGRAGRPAPPLLRPLFAVALGVVFVLALSVSPPLALGLVLLFGQAMLREWVKQRT